MDTLPIRYSLRFEDGTQARYELSLDPATLRVQARQGAVPPPWARLSNHCCANCTLLPAQQQYCPAALALVPVVNDVGRLLSHASVSVEVTTPERTVSAATTLQRAVASLVGLLMATSGCPHTAPLAPMARFHLPLASEEETIYRAASMYLLAQYFRRREGLEPDYELCGLTAIYRNLAVVNRAMARRLRDASEQDAAVNAVVLLDVLAKGVPGSIDDQLQDIRHLFRAYADPVLAPMDPIGEAGAGRG